MRKAFGPLVVVGAALFVAAPYFIAQAPYESTMGLIQKIMYYHVPSWIAQYCAITVCGVASAIYLFKSHPVADRYAVSAAELVVLFGLMGLITGPLWARKAWGVWWQWDVRLTSALLMELIFVAYLLVRQYGGPGSEKLASATALFGTATGPFVYKSVDIWRTVHPKTTVVPTLPSSLGAPLALTSAAFVLLFVVLLTLRVNLAERQAALDEMYLALED
ncbi:MAG: cytochrome C biogenesis protein CcmC [Acidobacteria bacterium]|nr:MAG: cytochrome C biogenesis protein CcmC [Acidobacteriota bacterium]PYR18474.1 MAG: cytochrome C biogenesis protein CcmC [Acidobacteriota bacterium]PYR47451.1 MAG: cytochrome C biogenesis protein CcmC [Acidobacteriota bacterium]